jgi:hypothetical protein
MWDPANSTAVAEAIGAHKVYPGSRSLGGGSLHHASNLVYENNVYREPSEADLMRVM